MSKSSSDPGSKGLAVGLVGLVVRESGVQGALRQVPGEVPEGFLEEAARPWTLGPPSLYYLGGPCGALWDRASLVQDRKRESPSHPDSNSAPTACVGPAARARVDSELVQDPTVILAAERGLQAG